LRVARPFSIMFRRRFLGRVLDFVRRRGAAPACQGVPQHGARCGDVVPMHRARPRVPGPPAPLSIMFRRRFLGRVLDFVRRRGAAPACQGVPQHGARCGDGVLMRRSRPRAPASPARSPSCFAGDSWERWWVAARRRDGKWLRWRGVGGRGGVPTRANIRPLGMGTCVWQEAGARPRNPRPILPAGLRMTPARLRCRPGLAGFRGSP